MNKETWSDLAADVLSRAYGLDADNLEAVARLLGAEGWQRLTADLTFHEYGAGGGLSLLAAEVPNSTSTLSLTDGELGLPDPGTPGRFGVAVLEDDWEDTLYFLDVEDGVVTRRGGRLVEEGRVPVLRPSFTF